ncbi:hypothetical protein BHM03_00053618, partial [Ensete ventricosum]
VRLHDDALEIRHLIVMRQAAVHKHLQLVLRLLLFHRRVQLAHKPVVLLQPPRVLHIEHGCI